MDRKTAMMIGDARKLVRSAFTHHAIPGSSPIACFGGQHRPKAEKRRPGVAARHQVHATATRAPRFSRPILLDGQQSTGYIHRLIAELDPLEFAWVQFRYRAAGVARDNFEASFQRAYFRAYEAEHLLACKTGTRRMVRYLISIAMENECRPQQKIEPAGGDVDRRNWNKTYRPHWRRIRLELAEIDSQALLKIVERIIAETHIE